MFNPMDVNDDVNHQQLYALDKLVGIPEFVKSAEMEPVKQLPSSAFADPIRRKFPCHTKAATWLANAYFQQVAKLYPKDQCTLVQDRIIKCADYWKIRGLVDDFNKKWEKMSRFDEPSLPDSEYAIVANVDSHKVRRLPMPTPVSVKIAGERLYADRFSYTYPMRKAAAQRILLKAAEIDKTGAENVPVGGLSFDIETESYLTKAAGIGTTHPQWAAEKLANRVLMMGKLDPRNEVQVNMAKVATMVGEMDKPDTDTFLKLAELVDEVDRATGICNHYIHGVELPEEIFFDVQEKAAAELAGQHVVLQNGNVYPISAFSELPVEKIAEVLGSEFADAIKDENGKFDPEKFAEVAPTLPRNDADLLERVIQLEKSAGGKCGNIDFSVDALADYFRSKGANVQTRKPFTTQLVHPQNVQLHKASEDKIKGGLADNKPDSTFPAAQLNKGVETEKEHTDSPAIAKEIAKDHLVEDKKYYTKLEKMEGKEAAGRDTPFIPQVGGWAERLINKLHEKKKYGTQFRKFVGGKENLGAGLLGTGAGLALHGMTSSAPAQRGLEGPARRREETPEDMRRKFRYE
jgi:hypothetical protein